MQKFKRVLAFLLSFVMIVSSVNLTSVLTVNAAEDTLEGLGTEESPWLISDAEDFVLMSSLIDSDSSYADDYYKMTANIDLKGVDFKGIAAADGFSGTFDGTGHVLKNVNIDNGTSNYTGVFHKTNGATIKNLGIESGIILNESIRFRADKKSSSEKRMNCSGCDSFLLYPVASGVLYGD